MRVGYFSDQFMCGDLTLPNSLAMSGYPSSALHIDRIGGDISVYGRFNFRNQQVIEQAVDLVRNACATANRGQVLSLHLHAEQMCTWSRKMVMQVLRHVEREAEKRGFHAHVRWTVDEGDDDMMELGDIFHELVPGIRFSFGEMEVCKLR